MTADTSGGSGLGSVAQGNLSFICTFKNVYKEKILMNIQVIKMIFLMDRVWGIGYKDKTPNFHRHKTQLYKCVIEKHEH